MEDKMPLVKKCSSTASVIRPRITGFYKNNDVDDYILLIPMSALKTREAIVHGLGHCSTLIIWRVKEYS